MNGFLIKILFVMIFNQTIGITKEKNMMDQFAVSYYSIPRMVDTSKAFTLGEYYLLANIGCGLTYLGPRDQFYAALARRWEVDRPGNSITFELRPDTRFSDGTPLTADEVVYTFKRLAITGSYHFAVREILTGTENLKTMADPFPGVVALDRMKVRFSFKKLGLSTLYLFSMADASIIHPRQVDPKSLVMTDWSFSSGAYFIAETTPTGLILKANPYFPLREKGTLAQIELTEIDDIEETVDRLNAGNLHYTMLNYLTSAGLYDKLKKGGRVSVTPLSYCATQLLVLVSNHRFFAKKENRQAFYRWFYDLTIDLRPLKNDWFVQAYHLYLPTQYGQPRKNEVEQILSGFPRNLDRDYSAEKNYTITYLTSKISNNNTDILINLFKEHGFKAIIKEYLNLNDWLHLVDTEFLFFSAPMYIDEKDLHEAFTYMLKSGYFYRENAAKAAELNVKLLAAEDKKEQAEIIRQLGLLLTEDALVIPLYHIVRQDIMNKDYEYSAVNGFHSVPTLWRIRRKTP